MPYRIRNRALQNTESMTEYFKNAWKLVIWYDPHGPKIEMYCILVRNPFHWTSKSNIHFFEEQIAEKKPSRKRPRILKDPKKIMQQSFFFKKAEIQDRMNGRLYCVCVHFFVCVCICEEGFLSEFLYSAKKIHCSCSWIDWIWLFFLIKNIKFSLKEHFGGIFFQHKISQNEFFILIVYQYFTKT